LKFTTGTSTLINFSIVMLTFLGIIRDQQKQRESYSSILSRYLDVVYRSVDGLYQLLSPPDPFFSYRNSLHPIELKERLLRPPR
jgi:hypothetical protein